MTSDPSIGAATTVPRGVWIDAAVILAIAVLITVASILLDLDRRIARAILEIDSPLGNLAETASAASFVIMTAGLTFLAVPALRRRWPSVARSAGVFAATVLIAVLGLIMSIKNEINRPRPDQTIEFGGSNEYRSPWASDPTCDCKAFPSSAAGFAFAVAAPYFVLRRRLPALAWSVLGLGLAWGMLVGYWRMVAGRHWSTDIVWSAAIVLLVASLLSHLTLSWRGEP